jgi:hypothetical protein
MRSIEDFTPVTYLLKNFYSHSTEIHSESINLERVLSQYPKLICVANHGTAPAPFAAIPAILDQFMKSGGGQRKPLLVMWRGFYKVPLIRRLVQYITQIDHAMKASDFLYKLEHEGFTDLFVMPEGENCIFGDGDHINPFLTPKFIEIAIKLNIPVLVAVHNGTEKMAIPFHLNDRDVHLLRWLPKDIHRRIRLQKMLSYPQFTKHGIEKLTILFQLYKPQLTEEGLSNNKEERYEQISKEAENVRHLMIEMKDILENRKSEYPWRKKGESIRRFSKPVFNYYSS